MEKLSIKNVEAVTKGLFTWAKKNPRRTLLVIISDENDVCLQTCKGDKSSIAEAVANAIERNRELIPVLAESVKAAKDYIMRTEMERP